MQGKWIVGYLQIYNNSDLDQWKNGLIFRNYVPMQYSIRMDNVLVLLVLPIYLCLNWQLYLSEVKSVFVCVLYDFKTRHGSTFCDCNFHIFSPFCAHISSFCCETNEILTFSTGTFWDCHFHVFAHTFQVFVVKPTKY